MVLDSVMRLTDEGWLKLTLNRPAARNALKDVEIIFHADPPVTRAQSGKAAVQRLADRISAELAAPHGAETEVAIRDGKYAHVPLAETAKPPRRVELAAYDTGRFRPTYADRLGSPLLLTPSLGPVTG